MFDRPERINVFLSRFRSLAEFFNLRFNSRDEERVEGVEGRDGDKKRANFKTSPRKYLPSPSPLSLTFENWMKHRFSKRVVKVGTIISDTRDCLLSVARSDSFSFIFEPVRGPSISENYSNAPGGRELRVPFNCAPVHDKSVFISFVSTVIRNGLRSFLLIFVSDRILCIRNRMILLLIS